MAEENNKTDREVWNRYIGGNNDALGELFDKYNGRFKAFLVVRKCKEPDQICQEVWSKIIAKRDSFDGESFSGWSFTIVRNLYTEQIRKTARRGEQEWNPELNVVSDEELFGLAKLEKREMMDVLKSCIEKVDEPFLTAFRMKMGGAATRTISREVGAAEKTVSTRVHRAKKMIQQCMEAKLA